MYFNLSCEGGYAMGCRFFGQLKERHNNNAEARRYLGRACELKDAFSCWLVAELEKRLGNVAAAKTAYKLGCDGVDGWTACFELGVLEEEAGNIEAAKKAYEKHCKEGRPDCGRCKGPNRGCRRLEALKNR